jgi:hypothetical protein
VSDALSSWLGLNWGLQATTLYDKAPSFFQPVSASVVRPPHLKLYVVCDTVDRADEAAQRPQQTPTMRSTSMNSQQ